MDVSSPFAGIENETETVTINTAWMISFADLLSVLLTFFILLYSMSEMPSSSWAPVAASLSKNRYEQVPLTQAMTPIPEQQADLSPGRVLDPGYLYHIVESKIHAHPEMMGVHLSHQEDRLLISLADTALFEKNSNRMTLKAISIMFFLGDILFQIGNKIDVESVASPSLLHNTKDFPSYWDLALSRAMVVAEELQKSGYVYNIDVLGLSTITAEKGRALFPDMRDVDSSSNLIHIVIHRSPASAAAIIQ